MLGPAVIVFGCTFLKIIQKYDLKTLPSILVLKDDTAVVFKRKHPLP